MNAQTHSGSQMGAKLYKSLFAALRTEKGDAHINDIIEKLRATGQGTDAITERVMKTLGPNAAVRVKRIAGNRAQHMATGTWQRYRMTRTRRVRLWFRDLLDGVCRAFGRGARQRS